MNLKLIIQILLITAIISTICICVAKPKMHKTVLVYDSGYAIVQDNVVSEETYDIMEIPEQPQTEAVKMTVNEKIDSQIIQEQAQTRQYIEEKQLEPVKTVNTVQNSNRVSSTTTQQDYSNKVEKQPVTQKQTATKSYADRLIEQTSTPQTRTHTTSSYTPAPVANTQKTVQNAPIGNNVKTVQAPVQVSRQQVSAPQPRMLTAHEEEIAWNKWRSRLQNQIMKDSKLPIVPDGTIFKFSFTVDKFGKVTNVKTYSANPAYTPYAIQYIAPVIRGYQGHSILTFPTGSSRTITDVTGSWKVTSGAAKYSTPHDYNDIERVTR